MAPCVHVIGTLAPPDAMRVADGTDEDPYGQALTDDPGVHKPCLAD